MGIKLPDWVNWLARDKDGCLCCYENDPEKSEGPYSDEWLPHGGRFDIVAQPWKEGVFPSVKWEDEMATPYALSAPRRKRDAGFIVPRR